MIQAHDQISTQFRNHLIEQFSLGRLLERYTKARQAGDVASHYWTDFFLEPFCQTLPAPIKEQADLHLRQRLEASYPRRLTSAWLLARRQEAKRILPQLGYFRSCGVRCSG